MKTLFLIRHAKSSWDDPSQNDFDRPLNDRGKKDAPKMAKRLSDKKINIEIFISSPAKRAKRTATYFIEEFGGKEKEIVINNILYEASPHAFFASVIEIDDRFDSAALFSHNPGITDFVNMLTEHKVPNMPTCAVFGVKADVTTWKDFKNADKELVLFDYPKKD